jgi:hypothetical protein
MSASKLLSDLNIPYVRKGEHHHATKGWCNVNCPFCESGEEGYHLGIPEELTSSNCWRCGSHPIVETLVKLSGLSFTQIKELIQEYNKKSNIEKVKKEIVKTKPFEFPSNCRKLLESHKQYLISRNFDPDKLEQEWNLLGTGPVSKLDNSDYKNRIIAPIYWNGNIVSFQGRSILKSSRLRYKACPKERELIEHQTILYGKQEKWREIGICVEGITDVWRLGIYSFAIFGISYTQAQVKQIAHHFKKVAILFDGEPQANQQADKLSAELKMRGIKAWRVNINMKEDPAELPQKEADYIVRQLMGKI